MIASSTIKPSNAPEKHVLAQGKGWQLCEFTCRAGPEDRVFEERHDCMTIAAVVSGTFKYRTDTGTAVMHPGSFLLGNSGRYYECGHEHSRGDRCIALNLKSEYFEEISASAAHDANYRFSAAMLPAMTDSLPQAVVLEALAASADTLAVEEAVFRFGETILAFVSGLSLPPLRVSARDEKRISEALYYIECNGRDPLELDALAAHVGTSKYHFLRTFGRIVGISPYQYLLNMRLRRVAVRLATSAATVAHIAIEEGFGDLSTFNRRFRSIFGESPQKFRAHKRIIP